MATSSSTYSVAEIEKISNNLVFNVKTKQVNNNFDQLIVDY